MKGDCAPRSVGSLFRQVVRPARIINAPVKMINVDHLSAMRYFSEREQGETPRENEEIHSTAWRGILAAIRGCVQDGSFGVSYPEICRDGTFVCGTNRTMLDDALGAEMPELATLVESEFYGRKLILDALDTMDPPRTLCILDLIEFCWKHTEAPTAIRHHSFFSHSHLRFDREVGREEFRKDIELILRRNGVAYRLTKEGRVERLVPRVFQHAVFGSSIQTGDDELDRLLKKAQEKFLDSKPETRRESLESLWDAWERLKTIGGPDKKSQTRIMLDRTAGSGAPKFRTALECEAQELTNIGNQLRIRHSETSQEILTKTEHMDYLFFRMFSLIRMIIRLTL